MSSLIIALISTGLVVLLAIVGILYLSDPSTKAHSQALQARVTNEGAQIRGAAAIYYAHNGVYAPDIPTLVAANYLTANPQESWGWFDNTAYLSDIPEDMCVRLNTMENITVIPKCDDPAIIGKTVCCQR